MLSKEQIALKKGFVEAENKRRNKKAKEAGLPSLGATKNKPLAKDGETRNDITEYGTDFRELQEASREFSNRTTWSERSGSLDEDLRRRPSRVLGQRIQSQHGDGRNVHGLLSLSDFEGNSYQFCVGVLPSLFRECFEIARTYASNGELAEEKRRCVL